jgi:hypothetical protein
MGVGYVVRCGSRTLQRLPALGDEALLHIESQWSESAGLRLYGFGTREDRKAFVLLQAIQGVGPKAAMAVLDVLSPAELASAVAREDKAAVGRASGVGPKLALRIVTELKDKPITDGPVFLGAPATARRAPGQAGPDRRRGGGADGPGRGRGQRAPRGRGGGGQAGRRGDRAGADQGRACRSWGGEGGLLAPYGPLRGRLPP